MKESLQHTLARRKREWLPRNEFRKRKALTKKKHKSYLLSKEEEKVSRDKAFCAAERIRRTKAERWKTKIWAWGVNSKKHPTYSLGIFPFLITMLVIVPIFGILYKLSFTLWGPVMIATAMLVEKGWMEFNIHRRNYLNTKMQRATYNVAEGCERKCRFGQQSDDYWLKLGNQLASENKYDEARGAFLCGREVAPDDVIIMRDIGTMYYHKFLLQELRCAERKGNSTDSSGYVRFERDLTSLKEVIRWWTRAKESGYTIDDFRLADLKSMESNDSSLED